MNERRSVTPKVVGILMIILASLGVLLTLPNAIKIILIFNYNYQMPKWIMIESFEAVIGLAISVLHLFAGIAAVRYKVGAPQLAIAYGIINVVINVALLILLFYEAQEPTAYVTTIRLIRDRAILGIVWSMIVMALMTRPRARSACMA